MSYSLGQDAQVIPAASALPQMVAEAISCHYDVFKMNVPHATEGELSDAHHAFDTYARCIAFVLGAHYPGALVGARAEMDDWRAVLEPVRQILTEAGWKLAAGEYTAASAQLAATRRLVELAGTTGVAA